MAKTHIDCVLTALSPITHMQGVAGNVSILRREYVVKDGVQYNVPVLSGNALRNRFVRTAAAKYLVETLGIKDEQMPLLYFLFHGGALTKNTGINAKKTQEVLAAVPFMDALGGSLDGQIITGALKVGRGVLLCEENSEILEAYTGVNMRNLPSSDELVSNVMYTRGALPNDTEGIKSRMIYEMENVIVGAKFFVRFVVDAPNEHVLALVVKAIRDSGMTVGGMGRIGNGQFSCELSTDTYNPNEIEQLIKNYEDYTETHKKELLEYLRGVVNENIEVEIATPVIKAAKKSIKETIPTPLFGV
jgi:hypothetical protein